jgi:dynein heavy chain
MRSPRAADFAESALCVFIIINPGYHGRTELSGNLKSRFRPIAMIASDYVLLEVVFYSDGFDHAKPLAQKVTQLCKLSSSMFSFQSHLNFGMRAPKSAPLRAGQSTRRVRTLERNIILIRCMPDSNTSTLLLDNTKLFDAMIGAQPGQTIFIQHGVMFV